MGVAKDPLGFNGFLFVNRQRYAVNVHFYQRSSGEHFYVLHWLFSTQHRIFFIAKVLLIEEVPSFFVIQCNMLRGTGFSFRLFTRSQSLA